MSSNEGTPFGAAEATSNNAQWTVIRFDRAICGDVVHGWSFIKDAILTHVRRSHNTADEQRSSEDTKNARDYRFIVVFPDVVNEEDITAMADTAASQQRFSLPASGDSSPTAVSQSPSTTEQQQTSVVQFFRERYLKLAERVLPTHHFHALRPMLEELIMRAAQYLTGVSYVGDVSPKVLARILSIGSELVAKIGAVFIDHILCEYQQQREPTDDSANIPFESVGRAIFHDARKMVESAREFISNSTEKTLTEFQRKQRDQYLRATCDSPFFDSQTFDSLMCLNCRFVVTQGAVALDSSNDHTVVLGSNGEDITAAILATKVGAARVFLYTDSQGLFSCQMPASDGRMPENARLLRIVSYQEAHEMISSQQPAILHPHSLSIVQDHSIPLHICSRHVKNGQLSTVVTDYTSEQPMASSPALQQLAALSATPSVKAVCMRRGVILITIDSLIMWQQVGFLSAVFALFKRYEISVGLVTTSEANVTLTLDSHTSENLDPRILDELLRDLRTQCHCKAAAIGPCAAVSIVGRNIRSLFHTFGPILQMFEQHKIYLMSQAASDVNLSFLIDETNAESLVLKLHEWFFSAAPNPESTAVQGPTWKDLTADRDLEPQPIEEDGNSATESSIESTPLRSVTGPHVWWQRKRTALLDLMAASNERLEAVAAEQPPGQQPQQSTEPSALYVYDEENLLNNAKTLIGAMCSGGNGPVSRVFFAMKANSFAPILRLFYSLGIGFECVSMGEVHQVLSLFPDIDRANRILYTPNFAERREYEEALQLGIMVTLDNTYPLLHWIDSFKGHEIFIRIDPGNKQARGHHQKVQTAGTASKFGIPIETLPSFKKICDDASVKVIGLHTHVGSGILDDPETWARTGTTLAQLCAEVFTDVRYIDVGGGLGVPEQDHQQPLDLTAVARALDAQVRSKLPSHISIFIEPGRFLVAESGVLLARVTQTKDKGDRMFIGVSTGMNSLIRPALYGSKHAIVNLTRIDAPKVWTADIVGPICETGDVLGHERAMPESFDGDVLLVATTGAYGYAMSSNYNLRQPATQILLPTTSQ